MTMEKCVICEKRPPHNGHGHCSVCQDKLDKQQRRQAEKPAHFLVYRGNVVGLFPTGGGELRGRLLRRSVNGLPKGTTINLDRYCPGFTREKIKRFKAAVLRLASN